MSTSLCPDAEDLDRLALGRLDDDRLLAVGMHLAGCGRCLEFLERDGIADPLLDAIRTSVSSWSIIDPAVARISAEVLQATYTFHPQAESSYDDDDGLEEVLPGASQKLGPYRLVRLLGAGGMGAVFAARDERLDRHVALKLLQGKSLNNPTVRALFLQEAKALAALPHEHIVPIWDVGQEGRFLYLAMPLLSGETLADRLGREQKLPWSQVARLGSQVAEALACAHAEGFLHRDIKPGNLWLTVEKNDADKLIVLDFGLAHRVDDELSTHGGAGTPAYMAPEQALGKPCVASDLYSLGCVLFRAGTGRSPFIQNDSFARMLVAATEDAPSLRAVAPDCPGPLADLIDRLLARNPGDRPESAFEVVQALNDLEAAGHRRRRRTQALLLLAVGLVLTFLGLWFGPALQRIFTQHGEILVQTEDPDVEIAVSKNGERIVILDGKTKNRVSLRAGVYDLNVVGTDQQFQLSTQKLNVLRGDSTIVSVRYVPFPMGTNQAREHLGGEIQAMAVDGSGSQILFGCGGKLREGKFDPDAGAGVWLGTIANLEKAQRLSGLDAQVRAVAISSDGALAVAADRSGRVALWELPLEQPARWLQVEGPPALGLAISREGQVIVAGSEDGRVRIWNRSGKLLNTLASSKEPIRALAMLPDSNRVLAGVVGGAELWDLAKGEKIRDFAFGKERALSLACDVRGERFLIGLADGSVCLCTLAGEKTAIEPDPDWSRKPWSVAFSRDAKRTAYSVQNTVRVWDIEGRRLVYQYEDHSAIVRALVSLPDGRRWISAGWDESIRIWATPAIAKNP